VRFPFVSNQPIEPDGTVIASARPFTPPLSIADRKFYRDVIRTRQFSPGEFVIGKTALKPLFNFGFPVTAPDGTIRAIIAVGIDLSYLDKTFKHFVLPEGSNFTIIDHKGIIVHRGIEAEKYIGKPILPYNFKLIIEGAEEGGYTSIGLDGVNRHFYFKKLYSEGQKEPYLYVAASIPEYYIQDKSQHQMLVHIAIFGLIFVVSLTGAFLIAKHKITSKVTTLLVSIKDLGMGRLNRKVSDQVADGEFGLLANAFDEMNTHLQERERESLRAETQYHMIIQTALDGFLVVDTNGRLLEANDAYCAMTGYSRDELCAMSLPDVEDAQSPEEIEHMITQVIKHGGAHFDSRHRCKDGRIIELDISITYSPDMGGRFYGFLRDITDRKMLEDQLRQSQKMEAVGQLAGGVAHDFNNILTVISGYSSLLQMDDSLNDEQKKRVDEIASSAERAAQLTRGLLAFSRKQPLIMKHENLNDIVQHVHKFLARIIGEDITFQSSCCGAELPIVADRGQIEQVLINL
ncbi:MAG: PAS domain S-box protein, partial [bacterium]